MRTQAVILASEPDAGALAEAVRACGVEPIVVIFDAATRSGGTALLRALRLARVHHIRTIISVSPPEAAHLVARIVARSGTRWTAHVSEPPVYIRNARWARVLDPRARALRRASLVTGGPAAVASVHAAMGAAVAAEIADPAMLAEWAMRSPSDARAGGLTLLMLGAVNTPHVEHLAIAMRDRGHRVVVAGEVVPGYAPSVLPAAGVEVRPLELPAMPWVRHLFRTVRPDVVHANWLYGYGFLAAAMRLRPLVAMAWGSDVYRATGLQLRKARYAARRADAVLADSADLLKRVVGLGADQERAHLLNWGVDLEVFAPAADRGHVRARLGLQRGPVVLSPRALTPLYNPGVIVEAFEGVATTHPDAQLVLKHIGTSEPELGRPLPMRTRIVGHVPYGQLPEWYSVADVCVSIPSSDSSPRSVWEAMASGCPCVLSDLPWLHELIEHGRHALVVRPEPDAVAAAITRLLDDPDLAARIGAEARSLVEHQRDQQVEMDRLSDLYRRTARQRA